MTDGNTAFLRAARSGNLEKVLEFINANVDINTSNSNGLNALHLASKDGHTKVVAELLKRGANVDAATKKGNTALHIASLAGQEEVVKLLIEHGATVNVQSQSGFTPLYMAAQENHERVVRFLLNNGANQSLATEDGFTPLAVAMQQGHDKVVTELLENDTRGKIRLPALHIAAKKDDCKAAALLLQSEHNPDITSKSGFTPLHIASHYGNDAIASLLLAKGADVNYAAKHNITPLHVAAKWGRNNMVVLLLEKGASIIAKTRDGLTPLHCAARSGHEQVVDTLLQRHAPITAKTKNGLAPLHMASQGDHVEAARVLLSHRAPVDDVTVDYLTALHVASHCGHVSVAKLLLDRKADPNARALNGFTPLHIACKKNRVKIVELLLKHGGSIEATTESGLSPLHVASFMGCMNIVIYLLQCEANPDVSTIRGETPLHLASRANQTDIIRILLRNGAQVDAKAREQQTPIHIASRLGNTDIVMLLLQHGANVDSVTKDLYTSLHIAAKEDQEEVALVLLENNASMTAATKKGFTPLHLAAKHGRTKIATLLLQRGAPVDAQGKNGVTPLHVASYYDHQGIALLLLDKGASPHATAKNGHTALHIAAKKNQMDIAAMLLEYGASAEVESKAGFTPIHLSAQEGHVDMTNLLLEHKAEVNHSSKNGLTPLHLCAQEDCVDVAKILIKHGADANAITKAGYTPLHIASHFGQLNMVRFLLSQNVKVDTPTATGYTSLHQAAQQGNSAIVAVLLDSGASPDSKNNQGQTALYIAQKLGYISVVEVLKNVTESGKAPAIAAGSTEEKYKVVAPETMQENFMSDSEDEGGDDAANEQSYRYLTIDEMKSLGDDSLPLDVTREDRYDTTAGIDESISPQHTYNQLSAAPPSLDNVDVTRAPIVQTGFLVSFLVDAKGGAMRGCRHSGVRVIVPSQCVTMPTRVTCRYIRRDKPNHPPPPPLMEGEALASRILELGPVGVKFLGPVVIEVPNFAALRGNEREIVILRSDNGETWREHTVDSSNEAVQEILSRSFDKDGNQIQADEPGRITSIVTSDFPHYFAVVSRIRQEVHAIGPEGGMVSSSVVPQVQAVFPQGALTKKIKVGLQAQPIPSDLTAAVLGNCVAVSPIVTIEPRRRKFHKPITLTLPVPQAANKGMINQYSGDAPTLRLLCSITGGTSRAQWEDVTGSTPLTFVKECVSFTTTVSARFWLMDIRDIALATKKATELYREAIHIPFMAKFVVFAKRIDNHEARLRVFCMTDDKEDKTLECQEHFTEVAKSRDVEVLEGKKQLIELSGNLISVTKSGDQLKLGFNAFQENRLPFTVRIKDSHADPIGRMLFFKEQKPVKTSTPHPPICVLNIVLPDGIVPDPEFVDSSMRKYSFLNDIQSYHRSELRFSDISNLIGEDWIPLSEKLGIMSSEAAVIKSEYPDSVPKQALTMLRIWHQQAGTKASANILESALLSIGRDDIVHECILTMNEKIKLPKPSENGILSTSDGVSHLIENYHIVKSDISLTDDDEKKYTAEEKVVDDSETKRSVSERKREIEKRLQNEPNVRRSQERSDSEEKRSFLEGDRELAKSSVEQRDIIKNVIYDEKEAFEPTSLTFEQKRLSFEKGVSIDKIVPDVSTKDSDKFIQIEKSYPEKEEVPDKTKKIEKLVHIDRVNLIPNKDETVLHVAKKENEFVRAEVEVTQSKVSEQQSGSETENLSFAEKRLSFELGPGFKAGSQEEAIKEDSISSLTKAANERRDSELFEGVSLGLEKLDTKTVVSEPSFLSPKPIKTPPPSPAEFKETVLSKQGSNDSDKGTKISSKDGEIVENNVKAAEVPTGDTQRHSYAESETPLAPSRDSVPSNVDVDYFSKKKFWQSFESAGEGGNTPGPVPKPRASICTSSLKGDVPPMVSRRSAENVVVVDQPASTHKEQRVNKAESEDNVVFVTTSHASETRFKPSMKQMHSLTAYSTDSEAEYIASCGIDKLAYENVAFSEEDEEGTGESVEGNVKAKKMFFEQRIQKEQSFEEGRKELVGAIIENVRLPSKAEEHIDKSELEGTEKKKECLSDDTEEPSSATPVDVHTNASIEGVDSTQSESDITPEELQDKQSPLPESESNHVDGSSESETCVGQVEPEIVESSKIGKPQNGLKDSPKIGGFTTGPEIITESEKKSSVKPAATAELKSKPEMTEEIIFKSEEQHLTREKESVVVETKTFGETKFSIGENIVERKSEIIEKSSSSDTKSEEITSSIKIHTDGAVMGRKESRIPVRVPSESKKSEESVHVIKTDVEEKKNSSEEFTTIVSKSSEKIENKESNETSTHEISKKTEKLKNIFEEGKTKTETSYKKSGSGISTPVDKFAASSKDFECVSENWDTKKLDNLKSVSVESEINQAQILKEPKICSQKYEVPEVQDGDVNILKRDMKFEKAEKSVISSPGRELTNEKSSSGELKSERLDKKIEPVILEFTKPQVITDFECLQKSKVVHGIVPSSEEFASMIEKSPSIDIPKKLEHDVQEDVKLEIVRDRLPEDSVWETEFKKKSNIPVLETTNTEVDVNEIKFETVSDRLSEIAVCKIESKSESVSSNKFEMSLENVPSLEKQNSDTGKKEIIAENVKSDDIKSKPKETAIPILPDDSKTENVVDVSDSSVQKISEEKFENIIDIGVQSKTVDNVKELIKTISGTPRTIADTQAEETKLIKNSKENQEFQSEAIMNTTPNLDAVSATVTTTCKTICKSDPKIPVSKTFSGDRVIKSESRSRIPSQHSSSDQSDSAVSTIPSASTVKSSPYKESSEEDLPDYFPHSSLPGDESLHEAEISDERVVLCDYSDRRISDDDDRRNISICDEEVKLVATNLIDEIETEINRRPDILENLVLAGHIDYLPSESNDDITDEDLRSTGTEADIVMPDNDYFKKLETDDDCAFASSKIEFSSPTEYEINYEQAEEFNVLESVDFEEQVIPEEPECLDVKQEWKGSFGMESCMEQTHSKPPIPEFKKPSAEIRRKSSEESNARNDLMSPESGSSDPSRKYEEVSARVTRSKRSAVDLDPCSSSSESHYHSFASDNRTSSRPCSSDVEGLLSCAVPGTTGSSDYDTAVSHDTSYYSHDFHTAVSSASIHESLKSIDSESSGHLGSAEGSSEVSETLVPSSAELEHDIDIASNLIYDENRKGYHRKVFFEPYDTDIPLTVIKGVMQSTGTVLETSSKDQIGRIETITKLLPQDDKLISSCEDTSSLSITEPNVPTVIEMQSTDSDRMDTSLTSEQSLTMSAISNQLATSTYDCKEELEIDRRSVDTNTAYNAETYDNGSVTLITSTGEDKGKNYVSTQVTSEVTTEKPATVEGASSNISPESESFELVEKPDLLDDFVIIEEVAKEATEQDTEGKAIRITERRKSGTFVGDGPPKIETTLTKVEYYGGADEGCTFEGVTFEEKQKVKEYENSPPVDYELNEQEVEEGKKWIEMQFQTDSEVASAYEYTYERAPLEDIKEEDTDDMQSSKVGSVSSQISQSIGSLGSMKQSLSSTPDYDILAGKRCFSKNTEPDAVSQASLQEFERLEQLMALESMKSKLSGSQDSLGSSSPGDKKRSGDDISVSSLKEFEGLEFACREAEKVEERAKAEERSLSQIEEGHESQASESESCETLEKSCYESDEDDDYDKKMFEIDEIIRQAQSNVEKFVDRIEKTESLGRGDSFEETARIPDLEFDQPLTDTTHSSSEVYSGKKFIDNIDLSHSLTVSTDSLEAKQAKLHDDLMITSSDSLEGLASRSKHRTASDSLDSTDNRPDSPKSNISERSGERELLHDDADVALRCRISPNQVSSPDSMDATSSAATHATYHNEMDSIMSSSFTSGGSNTMVSSSENLDNIVSSYSNWLEGSQQQQTYTTTEMVETVVEDKRYVKTHRTVEIPAAAGHDIHITYTGPDARQLHEMDVASFAPGEFVSETREVDAEGNVRVKRVLETRTVLASDRVEESRKFILDPKTLVDDRQTKMQSDPIISPADTDTVMEDEKKPDASDKVKGTKQKH